jgi:hypothetical protein
MSALHLNHAQEALLARLAAASGQAESEIIDKALAAFARQREEHDHWIASQASALAAIWDNDDDAVYDRL